MTITLMGLATAAIGFITSEAAIGAAAPIIIIGLRIIQGLALGGEYGGAAIYVSEHAPKDRRGYFTSFIQASVPGGFILSILVRSEEHTSELQSLMCISYAVCCLKQKIYITNIRLLTHINLI